MIAMCCRLPSTKMSATMTSADANPSPSAAHARSSNQLGATLDHRVGDGVDRGEPTRELLAQPVESGQLGRFGVADLRLVAVGPDKDLARQVERRERSRRHHGRTCERVAEDDELGIAELETGRLGLAAVVDDCE